VKKAATSVLPWRGNMEMCEPKQMYFLCSLPSRGTESAFQTKSFVSAERELSWNPSFFSDYSIEIGRGWIAPDE